MKSQLPLANFGIGPEDERKTVVTALKGLFSIALAAAFLVAAPSSSLAHQGYKSRGTILEVLTETDGAQAVVAAVLVVDEAGVLDFSLAELLGDRTSRVILLAPSNSAFENLLGLDPGSLDGLTIEQVKNALPGLLPGGVGPEEVAAILLKHASLPERVNRRTASEDALLKNGSIEVADGSEFPVSIGKAGTKVNYETTIVKPDIRTRNGYVHFIDTVIVDGLL
jgi:uncharacterized surface protein with fasciclin (FAS1) repeats